MKTFIHDVPYEFIEYSIIQAIEAAKDKRNKYEGDLRNVYFLGASLCLDTVDEFGIENVIVLHYDDEVFFDFVEGVKRLLTLKAIRLMDELMTICQINKETKFWIN